MPNLDLKQILTLDALSCLVMCLLCLLAGSAISGLTGLPPMLLSFAGWILLASTVIMFAVARQTPPWRAGVHVIILGNLLWVAASAAVMLFLWPQLTPLGILLVAAQAIAVLLFIWGEVRGAARLGAAVPA